MAGDKTKGHTGMFLKKIELDDQGLSAGTMGPPRSDLVCRFQNYNPPFAAAGARWTFGDKGGQMFERSEFLSARQTSAGRKEPAQRAR